MAAAAAAAISLLTLEKGVKQKQRTRDRRVLKYGTSTSQQTRRLAATTVGSAAVTTANTLGRLLAVCRTLLATVSTGHYNIIKDKKLFTQWL